MFGPITVVFFLIVFAVTLAYLLIVPPGPERPTQAASRSIYDGGTTTGKRESRVNYPDEEGWCPDAPEQTAEELQEELRKVEAEMERRRVARLAAEPSVIVSDPNHFTIVTPVTPSLLSEGSHNSFGHSDNYHDSPVHSFDHSTPSHDHGSSFSHDSGGGSFDGGGHGHD